MSAVRACLLVLVIAASHPSFAAQPASDRQRAEAAEHFARGLHLFEIEDNQGALAEFKRAYDLIPNPAVQFNLGLVYAALGQPVAAVDALAAVLAGPVVLKPEQLERARTVKAEQEAQIGGLRVSTNVPAEIEIDGVSAGRTPLAAPLRVAAGTHVVAVLADRRLPERREVNVVAGADVDLAIDLRPTGERPAAVWLSAAVPGAEVLVDGVAAGRTPVPGPLFVPAGERMIQVRRAGYRAHVQRLSLAEGEQARITITLEPEATLAAHQLGRLSVHAAHADQLSVTVDGRRLGRYQGDLVLPAGPHHLRLEREGHEPFERTVVVTAGAATPLKAELRPTATTRQVAPATTNTYRVLAYTALITGLVMTASGGGYAYWSNGKLDDANAAVADVRRACGGSWTTSCQQHLATAQDDVNRYRDGRTVGIVATSIGAAVAITGIVLLARGQEAKRDDGSAKRGSAWQPVLMVRPGGGAVGLMGRF